MKKIILTVLSLAIVMSCCLSVSGIAFAETVNDNYTETFAYKFVKDFCEKFPVRKAGINVNDPAQSEMQKYLTDCINAVSGGKAAVTYQPFSVSEYNRGYNIVARLGKSTAEKRVVIGAHYDCEGQGANDNASGVAAVLIAMGELSKSVDSLPFAVEFVLFDGEELGFLGSNRYVSELTVTEKENILLMINMDSIANGDNLYVWCENKRTSLAELILSKSDSLQEKPYAKGTYNLNNGLGYGYVETPQNSDQTPFRMAGIPTALFFSGTYSADPWNYSESENSLKNTMNSSSDTFANLDKYNQGEFVAKIETAADVTVKTVLDENFVKTAEKQREQLVNYAVLGHSLWASIICFGILVILLLVLLLVYYRKLQKQAILGKAEIKNNKVFSTPNADDIFTFEGKDSEETPVPSADDVFSFNDKNKK